MSYLSKSNRRHAGNVFVPLIDGEVAYRALVDGVRAAEKFIYIATWNLEPHVALTRSSGSRIHLDDELIAKAKAGVDVKVLVWDGVGQVKLAAKGHVPGPVTDLVSIARLRQLGLLAFGRKLRNAGSKHGSKSELRLDLNPSLPGGRTFKTGSHHQKLWLMDDAGSDPVAFIGGLNLGDHEWDTTDHVIDDPRRVPTSGLRAYILRLKADLTSKNPVRALQALSTIQAIVGPAFDLFVALVPVPNILLQPLRRMFVLLAVREVLSARPFGTRHDVHSDVRGPAVVEAVDEYRVRWDSAEPRSPNKALPAKGLKPAKRGSRTVQIEHTSYMRTPGARSGIADAYRHALLRAETFIYLENQYFTSMSMAQVIARSLQKRRDLQLIVVLPNKAEDLVVGPAIARRQRYLIDQLDRAAKKRTPRSSRVHFLRLAQWNKSENEYEGIYVHAKVGIIDDKWLTIGSANATERSLEFDTELNVFLEEPKEVRAFRQKLWGEHLQVPEGEVREPSRAMRLLFRQLEQNSKKNKGALKGRLTRAEFKDPGGGKYIRHLYDWLAEEFL